MVKISSLLALIIAYSTSKYQVPHALSHALSHAASHAASPLNGMPLYRMPLNGMPLYRMPHACFIACSHALSHARMLYRLLACFIACSHALSHAHMLYRMLWIAVMIFVFLSFLFANCLFLFSFCLNECWMPHRLIFAFLHFVPRTACYFVRRHVATPATPGAPGGVVKTPVRRGPGPGR